MFSFLGVFVGFVDMSYCGLVWVGRVEGRRIFLGKEKKIFE